MLVLICVMLFAFLSTVALSVDVAYMHLVKSELRSATDAASKAAAETLARTLDPAQAVARGKEVARLNMVANRSLELRDSDFELGRSILGPSGKFAFSTSGSPVNSVRVRGTRNNSSLGGSVNLFFGRMFNTGSFQPQEMSIATYIERDIVLVIDRSGSMLDFNKLVELKKAIAIFNAVLAASPVNERVGLATYSTDSTEDVDLTEDLSIVNSRVQALQADGFTNISGGIDAGGRIMSRGRSKAYVERTMIVLTDGMENRGRKAKSAAVDQRNQGVVIHSITFGKDAAKGTMRDVATTGKGRYYHAENGDELEDVFREIALTLSTILTE
jgi:Mg-chelatase subunit ChlD